MSRWLLAPALLALGIAAPVWAQDATGGGTVTESGRPIAGAAVTVDGGDAVLTDQDGKFTSGVSAGDHKFKVALNGYKPIEQTVTAAKDKAFIADFALEPLLQIQSLTVPATLAQGAAGQAQLTLKNNAASDYSIDAVGLSFRDAAGKDQSASFTVAPDAANAASIKAGATATLNFTVTPGSNAPVGKLTAQANIAAFDTALGKNLIVNGSFESGDDTKADGWVYGGDNTDLFPGNEGGLATDTVITGHRSAMIKVPEAQEGDVRAYWGPSPWIAIKPGSTYVLSGYVKTDQVKSDNNFGAAVYAPIVGDSPYQQPNAPWITGTRDWRKTMVTFQVSADASDPMAVPRGEIQQGTGTAWFDNLSLTEGTGDGSLTVTGGDQPLEVTKP